LARSRIPEFARPPWADMAGGLIVRSMRDDVTQDVRPALLAVGGAVLLLLVIAFGAGRARLVRQGVTECLLLAVIGGALGLAVAGAGMRALIALAPAGLPRVEAIGLNGPVFLFALATTTIVGLAIGIVSALGAEQGAGGLRAGLQQGARRAAGGSAV